LPANAWKGEAAKGNAFDLEQYGTLTDRLGRCFTRLGLERRSKNITPSLQEYLRRKDVVEDMEAAE
jgi:hypothetical protein